MPNPFKVLDRFEGPQYERIAATVAKKDEADSARLKSLVIRG